MSEIKTSGKYFISSDSLSERSGGCSGVNYSIFQELSKHAVFQFLHIPLVPSLPYLQMYSKMLRLMHIPAPYFWFSDERLRRNATEIEKKLNNVNPEMLFFFGFTPWIKFQSTCPYVAYNDICFASYVEYYNRKSDFARRDLIRIMDAETRWFSDAEIIFFMSEWAADEARKYYHLDGKNFVVAGRGGAIDIPENDNYSGGRSLLFISREFIPKGGRVCFEAFSRLAEKYPDLYLDIIGDAPEASMLKHPRLKYHGMLNKTDAAQAKKMQKLFSQAFCLVHPTEKDTNPLVISEAGYFGCPAISTRCFAIPELIEDNVTGMLIDTPPSANAVADALEKILSDDTGYMEMRKAVRKKHTQNHTWDAVCSRMLCSLNTKL